MATYDALRREIQDMISTATIGDGDQVLSILEKICAVLDDLDRRVDHVAEIVDSRRGINHAD